MLKILHINTTLSRGGAAQMVRLLQSGLTLCNDLNSTVLVSDDLPSTVPHVYSLGVSRARLLANVLAFRASGKDGFFNERLWADYSEQITKADIIHLHNAHGYYMSRGMLSLILRQPTIWTLHDFWIATGRRGSMPSGERASFLKSLFPFYGDGYPVEWIDRSVTRRRNIWNMLSRANIHFVSPSIALLKEIKALGVPLKRASVIPHGIFTNIDAPYEPQHADARRQLKIDENVFIILFAATRLDNPIKGFDILLKALPYLSPTVPWLLLCVGAVSARTRKRVLQQINHLAPHVRVRLEGPVPQSRMLIYYRASDVLAATSRSETFGLVPVEALGENCRVVCSNIPVWLEILADFATFFPKGDSEALAVALNRVAFQPRMDRLKVQHGIRMPYSLPTMISAYRSLYEVTYAERSFQ